MRPTDCQHGELTADSHFWPEYVVTNAKCKECGIRVRVQIPNAKLKPPLTPLQNVENIIRQTMTKVANGVLPKNSHIIKGEKL